MSTDDRIERETTIHAPLARVWALVSEPGWFIGDGDRTGQTLTREGDLDVLDDPRYGRFTFRTVAHEPMGRLAVRVGFAPPGAPLQDPVPGFASLVEFELTEAGDGVRLRVVESGFDAFVAAGEDRARFVDGNGKGWETQLGLAKAAAERVPA